MPLPTLPLWSIPPDWRNGVLERLEWRTSVLRSRSGSEQRIALRQAPRRSLEGSALLDGAWRSYTDHALRAVGSQRMWLPLWPEAQRVETALAPGATVVPCDTAHRGFKVGGAAALLGAAPGLAEVVEVAAVGPSSLTLAAPGTGWAWSAGFKVAPARRARLAEQPRLTRRSERVAGTELRFEIEEADDFPAAVLSPVYRGLPVLAMRPDEVDDLSTSYERLLAELDPGLGARYRRDVEGFATTLQAHRWFAHGAAEHDALRSLFFALKGRVEAVWLPTFSADLDLAVPPASGATTLTVAGTGYTQFGGPNGTGRRDLQIELRDGTALHRRVVASADTSGGREVLQLDQALPGAIALADVRRISWMALNRLDQDAVEIAHATDVEGVATAAAAFRSTRETRSAPDWTPIPLSRATQVPLLCGIPSRCSIDANLRVEFTVNSTIGHDVFSPTAALTGATFIHKSDNYWRVARWRQNWTPAISAWMANFWANNFGSSIVTTNAMVKDLVDLTLGRELQGEGTHPPKVCGWTPLALGELHYSSGFFPWFTKGWDWGRAIAAFWHSDTEPFGGERFEVWDIEGYTATKAFEFSDFYAKSKLPGDAGWIVYHYRSSFRDGKHQSGVTFPLTAGPEALGVDPLPWLIMPGPGKTRLMRVYRT